MPPQHAPSDRGDARDRSWNSCKGTAREEGPPLILVDSRGWIEYLAAGPKADLFAPHTEGSEPLVSSAIQIYEIYKVVRRDVSEERAVAAVSALRTTTIEPVADTLALEAADVALEYGLAMADAIIFATASRHKAEIVTSDADFDGLPGVTLIR